MEPWEELRRESKRDCRWVKNWIVKVSLLCLVAVAMIVLHHRYLNEKWTLFERSFRTGWET